jgi:hypothetical protein
MTLSAFRRVSIGPLCTAAVLVAAISQARAQGAFFGDYMLGGGGYEDVSSLVGATTFYNAGYTGTRAVVSNIEGGLFYRYHPVFANDTVQLDYGGTLAAPLSGNPNAVNDPNLTGDPLWTQYDMHATAVAGVIAAAPQYAGDLRAGIAYGATLVGGTVATQWDGGPYALSFEVTDQSFLTPYVEALQTGIGVLGGRRSNVINGSYGYTDAAFPAGTGTSGSDIYTTAFDGLALSSGSTVVWAAGNRGYGPGNVTDPGAGFNGITVGALAYTSQGAPFTTVAGFSGGGPSDFLAPGGSLVSGVRATVDIVAPGELILTALYSGATGGNLGATPPSNPVPQLYGSFSSGTSFAAPAVAGGASLLCDVGYDRFGGGDSINGAVIKAVLMNSADKIAGWDNGQALSGAVVTTTQGLDFASGTGAMNLTKAFTQYTVGTIDPSGGSLLVGPVIGVAATGWDYGKLTPDVIHPNPYNDYYFGTSLLANSTLTTTLTWFIDRTYDGLVNDNTGTPTVTASDLRFTNLELEVWAVSGGLPDHLVAVSDASYINTQHLNFAIPEAGDYLLRVVWQGDQYNANNSDSAGQNYALAWSNVSAPDAPSILLILAGVLPLAKFARRRA